MTQALKNCKFLEPEPTSYPAAGRYPQRWSRGFTGGMAAHHLGPLQQEERDEERQLAASLLPSLSPSSLRCLSALSTPMQPACHTARLLSSDSSSQTRCWSQQPRWGNLKEKRGWTQPLPTCPSAHPSNPRCCWLAALTRGRVLIPHGWRDGEEIQLAAEADRLSPCYSHGNT